VSKKLVNQKQTTERPNALSQCKPLLPALVAFGGVISTPALGLELGSATIESGLGQPLRASIAYALNPGENLQNLCIYLRAGSPSSGVPAVTNARLSLRNDRILITGDTPVKEPLVGLNISVECPGTPRLSREYTLFVDPVSNMVPKAEPVVAATVPAPQPSPVASAASAAQRQPVVASAPKPAASRASGASLPQGSQYRVQVGDTLSTIAARVEGRPSGVWKTVRVLFEANPEAFYDNNADRLKAGSLLTIPYLSAQDSVASAPAEQYSAPVSRIAAVDDFAEPAAAAASRSEAVVADAPAEPAEVAVPVVADLELSATAPETAVEAEAQAAPNTTLAVEEDGPFAAGAESVTLNNNAAPQAVGGEVRVVAEDDGGLSWWPILTGAAVGIFVALGLFGRSILRRFRPGGTTAFHTPGFDPTLSSNGFVPDRRKANRGPKTLKDDSEERSESAEDFQARLDATSQELEKVSAELSDRAAVIVQHEEPVIVAEDETQATHDETEELAFEAVASDGVDIVLEETTINDNVDFELLQQDYEAELTATQAVRLADAQAAIEALSSDLTDDADTVEAENPLGPNDETVQMPSPLEAALSIDESLVAEIDTALLEGLDYETGADTENDVTMQLPVDKMPRRRKKKVSNG
jgi:phage tail protein X